MAKNGKSNINIGFVFLTKADSQSPALQIFLWCLGVLLFVPITIGFCIIYPLVLLKRLWEPTQDEKDHARTVALVEKANELRAELPQETDDDFRKDVIRRMDPDPHDLDLVPVPPILRAVGATIVQFRHDNDLTEPVNMPWFTAGIEGGKARDRLISRIEKLKPENIERMKDTLAAALTEYVYYLPRAVLVSLADLQSPSSSGGLTFTLSLIDMLPTPGAQVHAMQTPFFDEALMENKLFALERYYFYRNLYHMNGKDLPLGKEKTQPKLTTAQEHKGPARDVVYGYLRDSALLQLFEVTVPFTVPQKYRFEHHWIVSPPGTGKSTTLSAMLLTDFDLVARGEASVIVMESNRDLIKSIERLQRFGPGGDLEGRLVVIDVEDVDYPVAINLFDVGLEQINQASSRDREALLNSAVSLLEYVFRALLGAELTSRQSTLFNFTIQLLIQIPNATLDTFIELMQPGGLEKYSECLDRLDQDSRQFFRLKFNSKEFDGTKSQVTDRIFAIKRIRALSRMFSAPQTKLNLFDETAKGKVILINAAKSLLQEEGVEVFGRFFLAMILLAAEKRQLLSKEDRMPTFVYIDECHDVLRRDEKIPIILDQARKFHVGMVLAHQRLDQLSAPVLNALYGSTAIKFAAQLSDANASALARNMGTTPEFIAAQPNYHYAASVRGYTQSAVSLAIPFVDMAKLPQMTEMEAAAVQHEMRRRYAVAQTDLRPKAAPSPSEREEEAQATKRRVPLITHRSSDAPSDW